MIVYLLFFLIGILLGIEYESFIVSGGGSGSKFSSSDSGLGGAGDSTTGRDRQGLAAIPKACSRPGMYQTILYTEYTSTGENTLNCLIQNVKEIEGIETAYNIYITHPGQIAYDLIKKCANHLFYNILTVEEFQRKIVSIHFNGPNNTDNLNRILNKLKDIVGELIGTFMNPGGLLGTLISADTYQNTDIAIPITTTVADRVGYKPPGSLEYKVLIQPAGFN